MRPVRAIIFALGVFITLSAKSQITINNPDCGRWIKSNTIYQRAWLEGYVSGLNVMWMSQEYNKGKTDPIKKTRSAEQLYLWVDDYCKKTLSATCLGQGFIYILS